MAEFGVQATQLSAPTKAGGQPVQAVNPAVEDNTIPSGLLNITSHVLDGAITAIKQAPGAAILKDYNTKGNLIASALTQGQISPNEADIRMRALGSSSIAAAGGDATVVEALNKSRDALLGVTGFSESQAKQKVADAARKDSINTALSHGFYLPPDASDKDVQKTLQMVAANKTETDNFQRSRAVAEEERASQGNVRAENTFAREAQDRQQKEQAFKTIGSVAGNYTQNFSDMATDLKAKVASGKMSLEEATNAYNAQYTSISAQIAAVETSAPGQNTGAAWTKTFDAIHATGLKMLDPKNAADKSEDELKLITNRAQIQALTRNPELLQAATANKLLPGVAASLLTSNALWGQTMLSLSGMAYNPTNKSVEVNALIGHEKGTSGKDLERGMYGVAIENANALKNGDTDPDRKAQTKNLMDNTLAAVTKAGSDPNVTASDLADATRYMAEPAFGFATTSGLLDSRAMEGAKKAWQYSYSSQVVKQVGAKFSEGIPGNFMQQGIATDQGNIPDNMAAAPKSLADIIEPTMVGDHLMFMPKKGYAVNSSYAASSASDMKGITEGLNQVIRAGAHLEGSTDYKKYWEENKSRLLPQFYASPTALKPGQEVNGWKWKGAPGANTRDPNNWERADAGSK
jgi:hypothetical protein